MHERVVRLPGALTMDESLAREFFRRSNPGQRLVTMDEVAGAVVQLLRGEEQGAIVELDGSAERVLHHPNRPKRPDEAVT